MPAYPLPVLAQGLAQPGVAVFAGPLPRHHHHIDGRQLREGGPKTLPHQSLDAIAVHGCWYGLAGDGQAEPGTVVSLVGPRQDRQQLIGGAHGALEDAAELAGMQQARSPWKGEAPTMIFPLGIRR